MQINLSDTVKSPLALLLEENDWGEYSEIIKRFSEDERTAVFIGSFEKLRREALYKSPVHGVGHIERVMLFGALLACGESLSYGDTELLMDMCAYHDTGRVSDWLDEFHGSRSCYKLEELTGRSGEELKIIMSGVEAHSRKDSDMDAVIGKYNPENLQRAKSLAILLKDADGLDRVRIGDLDPRFMRTESAKRLTELSEFLFTRYSEAQERLGIEPLRRNEVDRIVLEKLRDHVQECYFGYDHNCAYTTLTGLGQLLDTPIEPQTLLASQGMHGAGCFGAQCGLVEGALMFIGLYFGAKGFDKYAVAELCREYAQVFTEKYSSLNCRDLRPGGFNEDDPPHLCAGLTMDTILFAWRYICEKIK